ncbi:putative DNA helicase, ATP-dependent, Ku type [Rhizobium freirei PRF 81]|uniref:Ku protein n=4 Tax=Rhizobium TaxID=379 RepID=A0A6P1CH18_RHITR|nr:putative DNA helicase, ATP-dependent, Ku type [Rhizobium tropici CIAT 899]AYG76716.1 Ku protein [Rhizobium sp. CCGE532]ENN86685.1 putative DNA helicase, ATP-dependent, Ku type [Rhizobium freirei PRF 81]NEV14925.1 Ku protein [Rhizobium tropici]TGE88813.1 Ku protein [Rhizobium sp. SEMIA 4088]
MPDPMGAENMVGISRLVPSRRERAVMPEPCGKGIVLWTLRYGDEVRDGENYFAAIDDEEPEAELMPLVQQLIKKQTQRWSPKMVADPMQETLLDIINTKKKQLKKPSKAMPKKKAEALTGNVINIMDALRKSIENERGSGKQSTR